MKLYYLANVRIPTEKAHGYQICKMCEEFGSLGHQVELWVPSRKNDINKDAYSFYGLKNNFKIKEIKSFDFNKYYKYLGRFSFWLQIFWFTLKLLFIKIDRDIIIYTRDPEIGWIFNLKGNKTILEAHNWPRSKGWLFKYLVKKFDKIITITYGLKELFLAAGLPKGRIIVAPDGVDLEAFDIKIDKIQARKKLNLPLNKKIALYAGHLYGWKGASDLAEAAGRLGDRCLVIFVGGVETDIKAFKKRNQKLINDGQIILYRHQPHNLIPIWLKSADVLILPNKSQDKISKYYTSPMKLFEYMASLRPVVASDMPSIREILNEDNCFFFQPDSPEDLASKIKSVLADSVLAEKIAARAYEDVKNYTWEKRAEKIINFIK